MRPDAGARAVDAGPDARSRRVVLIAVVTAVVVGVLAFVAVRTGAGDPRVDPATAARTTFADLPAPSGDAPLPSLATLHPAPGTVIQAAGPFDDRFTLRRLTFDGTTVTATAEVSSDVSELLEFEALAGFYDRSGALVGTARHSYHLDESAGHDEEGVPDPSHRFAIAVPAELRGVAVAAAVGVPVLVHE